MPDKTCDVRFICTGHAARSVIAEGSMNALGQGPFITMRRRVQSVRSLPLASLDRMAVQKAIRDIGSR